jgi:hypothetical protein
MKNLTLVVLFLALAACSSHPIIRDDAGMPHAPNAPSQPPPSRQQKQGAEQEPESLQIDSVALQSSLGLNRSTSKLGYQERAFDTCQVGYGFSKSHNCQKKHFVVIHFQLLCRDTEGTTSDIVMSRNMQPISDQSVNWTLKNMTGTVQTDSEGYGQIKAISANSQSQQRLKLTVGNDFLFLRAGEVNRVVTPLSWCSQKTADR